jgi:hypothetical protein
MGHTYGTIEETLELMQVTKKDHLLNTLERFHIYDNTKRKLKMNDTYADAHNRIFDLITNNPN